MYVDRWHYNYKSKQCRAAPNLDSSISRKRKEEVSFCAQMDDSATTRGNNTVHNNEA